MTMNVLSGGSITLGVPMPAFADERSGAIIMETTYVEVVVDVEGAERVVTVPIARHHSVAHFKQTLALQVGVEGDMVDLQVDHSNVREDALLSDLACIAKVRLVPSERAHAKRELTDSLEAHGVHCDHTKYTEYLSELSLRMAVEGIFLDSLYSVAKVARLLIRAGASVEESLVQNEATLLHVGARHGCVTLIKALLSGIPEGPAKQKVLDHQGPTLATALGISVTQNHIGCMKALVRHGASLEVRDGFRHTPLEIAVLHKRGVCALFLADCGASVVDPPGFEKFIYSLLYS